MSVAALKCAYAQTGTSPAAQAVLSLLAYRYNDAKGCCYPGVARIASDTNLGRSKVLRALAELEEQGLITIEKRGGSGSGRQTNIYRLPTFKQSEAKSQSGTLHPGGKVPQRDQLSPALTLAKSQSGTQKGRVTVSVKGREGVASRRFPADWQINEETRALIRDRGYSDGLVARVLQKIKGHDFPKPVTDFDARFVSWLERERPLPGDPATRVSAAEQRRQLAAKHGLEQQPGESAEHFDRRLGEAETKWINGYAQT